ncbi:MAG: hypothetical protein IKU52_02525 [Clostridia bacterium]|nr:hypothetical protein [Clostridia bacterium]
MANFCGLCGASISQERTVCEKCEAQQKKQNSEETKIINETPDLSSMYRDRNRAKLSFVALVALFLIVSILLTSGVVFFIRFLMSKDKKEEITKNNDVLLYYKILDDIVSRENKESHTYLFMRAPERKDIGYSIEDIDKNGTNELLIYENTQSKNLVYEVYTIVNKKAVNLINSNENSKLYLAQNGEFIKVWEKSIDEWGEDRLVLDKNLSTIKFVNRVVFDFEHAQSLLPYEKLSDNDCYFFAEAEDETKASYKQLSFEEANEIRTKNETDKRSISGKSLLEYKTSVTPASAEYEMTVEYSSIIEALINSYPWKDNQEIIPGIKYSEIYAEGKLDTDSVGYALKDINGDGIPELLIAEIMDPSYLIDMFTVNDGKVCNVFSSFETRYSVCNNGSVLAVFITDSQESHERYELVNGELVFKEGIVKDSGLGKNSYAYYEENPTNAENVTQAEFESKRKEYESSCMLFEYTPLSAYIPKTNEEAEIRNNRYSEYLRIIEEYEEKYGEIYVVEKESFYNNIAGVSYAELIDFNGNGTKELLLCYDTKPEIEGDSDTDSGLRYEIFGTVNGKVRSLYKATPSLTGSGGNAFGVSIYESGGKYFVYEEYTPKNRVYTERYVYKSIQNGKFTVAGEFGCYYTNYETAPEYVIEGQKCTETEYEAYKSKWNTYLNIVFSDNSIKGSSKVQSYKENIEKTKAELVNP